MITSFFSCGKLVGFIPQKKRKKKVYSICYEAVLWMKLVTKEWYCELYIFFLFCILNIKRYILNNKMQHLNLLSVLFSLFFFFFKVWPNLVSCHCFGRTWNNKYVKFEWFPAMLFYQTGNFRKDLEWSLQFLRHQGGPAMAAKMICSSSWS